VGRGERAEQPGEGGLAGVVEVVLAAEEDDLVLEQRRAELLDGPGVEVATEVDALHDGADAAAELLDGEGLGLGAGVGSEGHNCSLV
jgi:hypothetical protein